MSSKDRREREREALRAKIMDAARDLFVRQGYDAVSMRGIADAIEYSPTTIYLHFEDKESLIRAICDADFGALAESFHDIARLKDPIERIRQAGLGYARFALAHPEHYKLMFMTRHEHGPLTDDQLEKRGRPDMDGYAFVRSAAAEALAAGRFRKEYRDADLVAQTLHAAIHGVVSLEIVMSNDPWVDWAPLDARVNSATDAILRGMLANPDELSSMLWKRESSRPKASAS